MESQLNNTVKIIASVFNHHTEADVLSFLETDLGGRPTAIVPLWARGQALRFRVNEAIKGLPYYSLALCLYKG